MQLLRVMPGRTVPPEISGVTIFAVYLEHDVHRADFFYVFHLDAVEPEDLGEALLLASSPARMEAA